MTDKWQASHTYVPGSLVIPSSAPPIDATQATNGDFEAGATGWTFSGSCAYTTSSGYSSSKSCYAPGGTAGGLALNDAHFLMAPGDVISATCMIQQGASDVDHTRGYVQVIFFNASDVQIGQPQSGNIVNDGRHGAWHASTKNGAVAPAGTTYARCGIYLYQNSNDPIWGDNLVVTYARTAPPPGLIYKAVQAAPGKSAPGEPTWPLTNGVQVIDNQVTWEAITMVRVIWEASPILLSGATEPTWSTEIGGMVHDGTINWEAIDRRVSDVNCPQSKVVAIMASKVFAADKDIVRFSATVNPLDWTTPQDAGYLPTGLQQANANDMAVLAPYRSNMTAFNASTFQNWQVDPDPSAMALLDQMEGIGSGYQHAAQPVGNELFYLSQLGVRSVSVAAGADSLAAGDVGIPIDSLVQDAVAIATQNDTKVLSTYYPSAGQYWLAVSNYPPQMVVSGDLPDGYVGQVVNYQYQGSSGFKPYTFTIASGALPDGLSMNANGLVTGTRTTVETSSWVVSAVDALGTPATLSDTSQTVIAVWATWNPFDVTDTYVRLYSSNTTFDQGGGNYRRSARATVAPQGKAYFELVATGISPSQASGGVADETETLGGGYAQGSSTKSVIVQAPTNIVRGGNATLFTGIAAGAPYAIRIGIAVDAATRKVWLRSDNGAWWGGGDPVTMASPTYTLGGSGRILPCCDHNASGSSVVIVSDPAKMTGLAPDGFDQAGLLDTNPDSTAAWSYDLDFGTFNVGVSVTKDLLIGPYPTAYSQTISGAGLPTGIFQTLVITGGLAYSRLSGSAYTAGSYTWIESFQSSPTGAQVIGTHKVIVNP